MDWDLEKLGILVKRMMGAITHDRIWRRVDRMGYCSHSTRHPLPAYSTCHCLLLVHRKTTAIKQQAIDELERRVAALEQERKRPKS